MTKNTFPILYSFRRCPYAMRARLALLLSDIKCELREVVLKDKPDELLQLSPKGTVPVLITTEQHVIDESIDIMKWGVEKNDPCGLWQPLNESQRHEVYDLIAKNDGEFKYYLDRYKYADRYPEYTPLYYREKAELFLIQLDHALQQTSYLISDKASLADLAIWPFIRQFAFVDKNEFDSLPYPALQKWLEQFLNSNHFFAIMTKYPQWHLGDRTTWFPEHY